MILVCTCIHPAQDSIHGKFRRVFNPCRHDTAARCTVCKKEQTFSKAQVKDIKSGGKK